MSKKKTTATHNDPLAPTKTKTGASCLDAVKQLLKEGNGRIEIATLSAKVGGARRVRHAIWIARYAGIKLTAVRKGRVAEAYVQTTVADTPQTKAIPAAYKPHWNAKKQVAAPQAPAQKLAPVAKAAVKTVPQPVEAGA